MPKQTLEAALLARRDDPRAMRGALTIVKGKPRIVFGVVGDHGRFSVEIKGDKFVLCDDPCKSEAQAVEIEPEGDDKPLTAAEKKAKRKAARQSS